jgi:formate transporter
MMQSQVLLKPLQSNALGVVDQLFQVHAASKLPHLPSSTQGFASCSNASVLISSACLGVAAAVGRKVRRNPVQRKGEPGGMVETPQETYDSLVKKGESNAKASVLRILHSSFMGGCYVGMSGLLSLTIAGNLMAASVAETKMVFAALFPINLLLVLQSGAQLFTGNTATLTMARLEGKATSAQLMKVWVVSILGNLLGCLAIAWVSNYTGLLAGGTAGLAAKITEYKCSYTFFQTLVKAIMCNWLVCMAVWLSTSAKDLTGKMVGVWFPISMFVATGFEHSIANFFVLPTGLLAGASISVSDVIFKNFIPVCIGNAIAGTVIVAASFSYMFGSLGKPKTAATVPSRKDEEAKA